MDLPAPAPNGEDGEPVAMARLPRDLLSHIFGLLDVAERARASRVCRRWRATALEPPHSTRLALRRLRLIHKWNVVCEPKLETSFDEYWFGPEQPWPKESWAPDPTALAEPELRLALRSPLAAGATKLSVALGRADREPEPYPGRIFCAVRLEAMPASVTSLEIVYSDIDHPDRYRCTCGAAAAFDDDFGSGSDASDHEPAGFAEEEVTYVLEELDALHRFAPQLLELSLRDFPPLPEVPRHAGLERLSAGPLRASLDALLKNLPSLQRLGALSLRSSHPEGQRRGRALAELAERGLRVRSLDLYGIDLYERGMVEAVSALFQPNAAGFEFCSEREPAALQLVVDQIPDSGLPASLTADVQHIMCMFLEPPRQSILPWLTAISRGPSLQLLQLIPSLCEREPTAHVYEPYGEQPSATPRLEVRALLPWTRDPAQSASLVDACEFLAQDRALLRAVSVDFDSREDAGEPFRFVAPDAAFAALCRCRAERIEALAERPVDPRNGLAVPLALQARLLLDDIWRIKRKLRARALAMVAGREAIARRRSRVGPHCQAGH